jgi:hypothetical protein
MVFKWHSRGPVSSSALWSTDAGSHGNITETDASKPQTLKEFFFTQQQEMSRSFIYGSDYGVCERGSSSAAANSYRKRILSCSFSGNVLAVAISAFCRLAA